MHGREVPDLPGPLNLGTAMRELERLLERDAIVTTDAGNFAGWATRFIDFKEQPALYRPDERRDGLQCARRDRRQDRVSRPYGGVPWSAMAAS